MDHLEDAAYEEKADAASDEVADMTTDAEGDLGDDAVDGLIAEAMLLRRQRREALLKSAQDRFVAERVEKRNNILKEAMDLPFADDEADDETAKDALDDQAIDALDDPAEDKGMDHMKGDMGLDMAAASIKNLLQEKVASKKADEEREGYRIKLRRAYDVGLEMQRKGLLAHSKTALDKQVDEIMTFDDNAFEAFKRSIANARSVGKVKIASDLGGVNIGVESERSTQTNSNQAMTANTLSSLWD